MMNKYKSIPENEMEIIIHNLLKEIVGKDMCIYNLSDMASVSVGTIIKMQNGIYPSPKELIRMCIVLDVSPEG